MLNIKKLVRPTCHSGYTLPAGETVVVHGLTIVNNNAYPVYVDKNKHKPKKKSN